MVYMFRYDVHTCGYTRGVSPKMKPSVFVNLPNSPHHIYRGRVSLEPRAILLTRGKSPVSLFSHWGYKVGLHARHVYVDANSSPHGSMANALPTEPSIQLHHVNFSMFIYIQFTCYLSMYGD